MIELPEVNNRIKRLVEEFCKGNVQQFVDMVGIKSHQNLNRIFNIDKRSNKYPSPSSEILTCIQLKLPQVNYNWLLTGEGEMLNSSQAIVRETDETGLFINTDRQPILDIRVCAGSGLGLEGDENKIIEWVSIPSFKGCKGITVYGDSMYDKFKSGDVIFVRPIEGRNDVDYGQCYVVITREDRYIKNIYESSIGDEYVTMVSYNTEVSPDGRRKFPDRDILKEDIVFLYKVAGKLRRSQL